MKYVITLDIVASIHLEAETFEQACAIAIEKAMALTGEVQVHDATIGEGSTYDFEEE